MALQQVIAPVHPFVRNMSHEQREKFWAMLLTPPRTNHQLQQWVWKVLGVWISDVQECENHTAPLVAFADAYFARHPRAVWKGSRGLAGKTVLLALLSLTEAITLGAKVSLLGGSGEQSKRVLDYMSGNDMKESFWNANLAPRHLLLSAPTQRDTRLKNGGRIAALMASSASVRGPHPQRLRGDEIDEMDQWIWDSAAGQPMAGAGANGQLVKDHILGSSTHHYPNGTMTEELRRAAERGFPVFEWCYRENLQSERNPRGWLSQDQVERKRSQVTTRMWDIEYELGEPSIEGRAIDSDSVNFMFSRARGYWQGELGAKLIIEPYVANGRYAAGADWAKTRDKSIFTVLRIDTHPARVVAWYHMARMPYPVMIRAFDQLVAMYHAAAAYDMGGIGAVIGDYTESAYALPVQLQGLRRTQVFDDYIVGIEGKEIVAPFIEYAYREHKFVTGDDLYSTSGHPPDSFISAAVAWWAKDNAMRRIFY